MPQVCDLAGDFPRELDEMYAAIVG